MLLYKGVVVGSSELGSLLKEGKKSEAKRVFDETTRRYQQLYPEADRIWFDEKSKEGWPMNLLNKEKS